LVVVTPREFLTWVLTPTLGKWLLDAAVVVGVDGRERLGGGVVCITIRQEIFNSSRYPRLHSDRTPSLIDCGGNLIFIQELDRAVAIVAPA
jgi:hypothetical protein